MAADLTLAYVINQIDDTISVINMETQQVVQTISLDSGSNPTDIVTSPDQSKLFVVDQGLNQVSTIKTDNNTITNQFQVGTGPYILALNPQSNPLLGFVTNTFSDDLSVANLQSEQVINTIATGVSPIGVALSIPANVIYVANSSSDTVSVYDLSTLSPLGSIPVGAIPYMIAFTPDGTKAYVGNFADDTVSVIDVATSTVIATISVGINPYGVVLNAAGTFAYVANCGGDSISVINVLNDLVVATIPLPGAGPNGIAITPDQQFLLTANSVTDSVSIINLASNTVVNTIPVGQKPVEIAFATIAQPPMPPSNFRGRSRAFRGRPIKRVNVLRWRASPDPTVKSYLLQRNHHKIASIPKKGPYRFKDRLRQRNGSHTYTLYAVGKNGLKSSPLTLQLP